MRLSRTNASLLAGAVALFCAAAGCARPSAPSPATLLRFESPPRPVLAAAGTSFSRHPRLWVSPSGTVFLLAVHGSPAQSRLGLFISHDGGDTFGPPVPVSATSARINSHGENSPVLAATPREIYAVWEQRGERGIELMLARSLTFGHSFDPPVRVTDKTAPSFNGFASAAVAPSGDLFVAWLDGRDPPDPEDTFSLYLARSRDRGASFEPNVLVARGACPCCRPAIAIGPAGELHIFWRKLFPDNVRDIVVSTSRDAGRTFAAPVRVSRDDWKLNGCPDSGPAALVAHGRLYVAWLTEPASQLAGVRLSWSDDGGKSFAAARDASQHVLDANRPSLAAADNGELLLAFHGREPASANSWAPLAPFVVRIRRDGTLSAPVPVAAGAARGTHAHIALGTAGRVFLAWTSRSESGSAVLFSRARLSDWR